MLMIDANKPKKKLKSGEATEAAEFLRELDKLMHKAVRATRSKKVSAHLTSAGLGIQDALTDLNSEYETGVPNAR